MNLLRFMSTIKTRRARRYSQYIALKMAIAMCLTLCSLSETMDTFPAITASRGNKSSICGIKCLRQHGAHTTLIRDKCCWGFSAKFDGATDRSDVFVVVYLHHGAKGKHHSVHKLPVSIQKQYAEECNTECYDSF